MSLFPDVSPDSEHSHNEVSRAVDIAMEKTVQASAERQTSHVEIINMREFGMTRLEAMTKGQCLPNSVIALKYLLENHENLFDGFFRLISEHEEDTRNESLRMRNGINPHGYFLVLGKDGYWYAGSPANHRENMSQNSPIYKVFSSKRLEEVLDQIKTFDQGQWPSTQFIRKKLPTIGRGFLRPAIGETQFYIFKCHSGQELSYFTRKGEDRLYNSISKQ